MPKRTPIDYKAQFAEGIFRPQAVVASELAEVDQQPQVADPQPSRASRRQSNERTVERTKERLRVRHSFDIWQDQLLALAKIQAQVFSETGRKPKMGELVQSALDTYIANYRKRTNERSNERTAT